MNQEEIERDFQGATFDLSKYGFKAASDYLRELEKKYGRMFVEAIYDAGIHTISIKMVDDV